MLCFVCMCTHIYTSCVCVFIFTHANWFATSLHFSECCKVYTYVYTCTVYILYPSSVPLSSESSASPRPNKPHIYIGYIDVYISPPGFNWKPDWHRVEARTGPRSRKGVAGLRRLVSGAIWCNALSQISQLMLVGLDPIIKHFENDCQW